jgi:alpha-tubulin suppressor-like RCC1 family protein
MNVKPLIFALLVVLFTFSCKTEVSNKAACGDGILDPGEQCDLDVFTIQNCAQLNYYEQNGEIVCNPDCTMDLSVCAYQCGDGLVQADHEEECDGATMPETTCAQIDLGGGTLSCTDTCRYDVSQCEAAVVCGDNQIQAPFEQCEGDDLAGETCISQGYYGGTLACDATDCRFDTTPCETFGSCGDSEIQGVYEDCEGVDLNNSTCIDQGWFSGDLQCSASCEYDFGTCQNVAAISAANIHSCILLTDGTVRCWGDNQGSQLGFPGPDDSSTPVELAGLSGVTVISAGFFHSCAVLSDGTGRCWGAGTGGQLGNGTSDVTATPVVVSGLANIRSISAGYWQTCAVLDDDTAWCWGFNGYGQLGDGTIEQRLTPVSVSGLSGVLEIGTGRYHSCALLVNGGVKCWGYNESGQLGDGVVDHGNDCNTTAVGLAVGGDHACALLADGTLRCWGDNNYGQLGVASAGLPESPTPVTPSNSNLLHLTGVFAGGSHTCAIIYDNTLNCWGNNADGQLGDGTTTSTHSPRDVVGMPGVVSVDAGVWHTCAVAIGGNIVRCWGRNEDGQIGDGTTTNSLTPVDILP